MGISGDVKLLDTQWWRTCCEPGVISTGVAAGGARLRLQVQDQQGNPHVYLADVFVRETSYWGTAGGSPPRDWVVRDVYADGQEPVFWRWVADTTVRYIDTPVAMP